MLSIPEVVSEKGCKTKNFNGKFFRGKYPRNPYVLRIQKMYMKGGYNKFLTLFRSAEVG